MTLLVRWPAFREFRFIRCLRYSVRLNNPVFSTRIDLDQSLCYGQLFRSRVIHLHTLHKCFGVCNTVNACRGRSIAVGGLAVISGLYCIGCCGYVNSGVHHRLELQNWVRDTRRCSTASQSNIGFLCAGLIRHNR